jgi:hypothetical protein
MAVKMIDLLEADRSEIDREIKMLTGLDHPNIVKCWDVRDLICGRPNVVKCWDVRDLNFG